MTLKKQFFLTHSVLKLCFAISALFMALLGIISRVLRNEEAAKKQRTTARIGQILGIVMGLLLVVLLFYFTAQLISMLANFY